MFNRVPVFAALFLLAQPTLVHAKPFAEMFPGYSTGSEEVDAFLAGLDYKQGDVRIEAADAALSVGPEFYFLDQKDTRAVLEQAWGNPPDPNSLGMIFPADKTPFDDAWGAVIQYDEIGFVSDEDAAEIDYDDLLKSMQSDTRAANPERRKAGFPALELVGWAAEPRYDTDARSLYWAKELKFTGEEINTANYNIRALGRRGVLITNFVAAIDQIPNIERDAPAVMAMVAFEPGARYADFDPSMDTVAAVGIGGLIAGKVIAKSGFLIAALLILKKFWFLLFLPLIWIGRKFRSS